MKQILFTLLVAQAPFNLPNDGQGYIRHGGTQFLTQHAVGATTDTVRIPGDDTGTSIAGNKVFKDLTSVRVECDASSASDAVFCWSQSPATGQGGSMTLSNGTNTGVVADSESAEANTGSANGEGKCFVVKPGGLKDDMPIDEGWKSTDVGWRGCGCALTKPGAPCNEDSDCGAGAPAGACACGFFPKRDSFYLLSIAKTAASSATCEVSIQQ